MSPQMKPATTVRIASVTPNLVSQKLRVAGRVLTYDPDGAILLLADGDTALFVDISLCLKASEPMPWLRENNSVVMILGYLEELLNAIPLPALSPHAPTTEVDPYLVLSAILITESRELDMAVWKHAIAERETLR